MIDNPNRSTKGCGNHHPPEFLFNRQQSWNKSNRDCTNSPPAARIAARAAWGQNYLEKGIAAETILGRRGEDRGGEGEGEGEGDGGVAWTARGVGEAEAEAEAEAETQQRGKEETGE